MCEDLWSWLKNKSTDCADLCSHWRYLKFTRFADANNNFVNWQCHSRVWNYILLQVQHCCSSCIVHDCAILHLPLPSQQITLLLWYIWKKAGWYSLHRDPFSKKISASVGNCQTAWKEANIGNFETEVWFRVSTIPKLTWYTTWVILQNRNRDGQQDSLGTAAEMRPRSLEGLWIWNPQSWCRNLASSKTFVFAPGGGQMIQDTYGKALHSRRTSQLSASGNPRWSLPALLAQWSSGWEA